MNTGAAFWLVVFAVSALLFFSVALVVAIRGLADVRDLLKRPEDERTSSRGDPA